MYCMSKSFAEEERGDRLFCSVDVCDMLVYALMIGHPGNLVLEVASPLGLATKGGWRRSREGTEGSGSSLEILCKLLKCHDGWGRWWLGKIAWGRWRLGMAVETKSGLVGGGD